jgi:hypothetical protein
MEPVAVPFACSYLRPPDYTAIAVEGVLRTEPDGLVIEFRERVQVANSGRKVDKSIRTLEIPWADVQSITVREPWLVRPRIVLRTRSLRALDGLPQARGSEVTLPVPRADRGLARELSAHVDAAIAEHRLRALDAPAPHRALPPT